MLQRKRIAVLLPVLLVMVAALAGCSDPEKQVIGRWKVQPPSNTQAQPGDPAGQAMAMAMLSGIKLELKEDHTFSLQMFVPVEGKWALEGETLTLTPEKIMGVAGGPTGKAPDVMTFTVSDDGEQLVPALKPEQKAKAGQPELVFVRDTA